MNLNLNFTNGPDFLNIHLEEKVIPKELEEKALTNAPPLLRIEGRSFIVSIVGSTPASIQEIQQKIGRWQNQENLTLKEVCAGALNIKPEELLLEEKYATLASIQQLAQETIHIQKEQEARKVWAPFKFKHKTLHEATQEKLDKLIESHDKVLEELNRLSSGHPYGQLQLEKIYYRALVAFKDLINNSKIENLNKQLKEHKLEMLRLYYMMHQQIVVKESDEPEKRRAAERLSHLLDQAIIVDHLGYVSQIISAGAKIEDYQLFYAIVTDASEVMDKLIKSGGNPNTTTQDNRWSILQMACFRGGQSEQAACALVRNGANLKSQDGNKNTPIHAAIESDISNETIEEFINLIDDLNFVNQKGETLLHAAVNRALQYQDPKIVEFLLKSKVDLNRQDEQGRTPLHLAIRPFKPGVLDLVQLLIGAGADVTKVDHEGRTPLHYAAERSINNVDLGKKDGGKLTTTLIAHGANVNAQDNKRRTPLHEAVGRGAQGTNQKTVMTLINSGADLNIQDQEGNTPLHLAVWMEHVNHVKVLLNSGTNRNIRNKEGKLPGAMGVLGQGISRKRMEAILNLLGDIKSSSR